MNNVVTNITHWPFLNEPVWRWGVFFVGATLFIGGWNGVLNYMK